MNSTSPPSPRTCESWPSSSPDHSRPPQTEGKTGRALTLFGLGAHHPAAIREFFNTIGRLPSFAVTAPTTRVGFSGHLQDLAESRWVDRSERLVGPISLIAEGQATNSF